MRTHSICGTELEMELGESPIGYFWWRCPKCNKRIPLLEIKDTTKNISQQIKKDEDVALNEHHLETRRTAEEDIKKERKTASVDTRSADITLNHGEAN